VPLPWNSIDWIAFKPIATNPQAMRYVSEGGQPGTDAQITEFVERQRNHYGERKLCLWKMLLRDSNGLIGVADCNRSSRRPRIEIAWWPSPELLESWNRPGGGDSRLCGRVFGRCGLNRIASVAQE